MAFGKERPADLKGVVWKSAIFWSGLPSKCDQKNTLLNCGQAEMVFSEALLSLFGITSNPEEPRKLNFSAYSLTDRRGRGLARVSAQVDGKSVVFRIVSAGSGKDAARRVIFERDFPDGREVRTIRTKNGEDGRILKAMVELLRLDRGKVMPTDKWLLCGTCTAKVNGLPGSIV